MADNLYRHEEQARKERQERKRAKINCVRLKLIQLRRNIDKDEQHLEELIQNLHRCAGESSATGLNEQESWVLIEQCCRAISDLNNSKKHFAAAKKLIDRFIERYDERRKTHIEWMGPPRLSLSEMENIRKMFQEESDTTSN